MRGANYIGNCSGFDQLLIRSFEINECARFCAACYRPFAGKPAPTGTAQIPQAVQIPVGAGLPAKMTPHTISPMREHASRQWAYIRHHSAHCAPLWCTQPSSRPQCVHDFLPQLPYMPANAAFCPRLAIFGHWHAICSLVRQVRLADYPRLATPFFQSSGPPRSRPSGGQHVEVGSTHQRS